MLSRGVSWLLFLGSACVTTGAEDALLERATRERACGADKLTVTSLGASAYRVEGCGPPETFICVSYQGWVCTREGGPQSAQRVLQTVSALSARASADARDTWLQQQMLQASPPQEVIVAPPPVPPPPPTF